MAKRKMATKRPLYVKNPRTFKQMLHLIDAFLAANIENTHGSKLWDVMSATRGPDEIGGEEAKNDKTVPIRRAAFPLVARKGKGRIPAYFGTLSRAFVLEQNPYTSIHFDRHATAAAVALGLLK